MSAGLHKYRILSLFMVVVMIWGMLPDASALEPICGIEEHIHDDSCHAVYGDDVLACRAGDYLHQHDDACYDNSGVLTCYYADFYLHRHSVDQGCYDAANNLVCQLPEYDESIHEAIYDTSDNITCVYAPRFGHVHGLDCYETVSVLTCGQEQDSDAHRHDDSCYESVFTPGPDDDILIVPEFADSDPDDIVDEMPVSYDEIIITNERTNELTCNYEESGHVHDDSCYESVQNLICGVLSNSSDFSHDNTCHHYQYELHVHVDSCFDNSGRVTCGKWELRQHTHDSHCFERLILSYDNPELTCNKDEHVHSVSCYFKDKTEELDAFLSGYEDFKLAIDSGEYDLESDDGKLSAADAAYAVKQIGLSLSSDVLSLDSIKDILTYLDSFIPDDYTKPDFVYDDIVLDSHIDLMLLYADREDHPDGQSFYPSTTGSGYIKLEPYDCQSDLSDVVVTVSIPKIYVERNSIAIPVFDASSPVMKYRILDLTEDDSSYYIGVYFDVYDKTQTLVFPFTFSFLDGLTPVNYLLNISASIQIGDSDTRESNALIFRPEYYSYTIEKFANSSKVREFSNDGVNVVVTPKYDGDNPYLDDLTYGKFWFLIQDYPYFKYNCSDYRYIESMVLTDVLPEYIDRNGQTRKAYFNPDMNPGWTLSEDGLSVFKTYTGSGDKDIPAQVAQDCLYLGFPGLELDWNESLGLFEKLLSNSVSISAIPQARGTDEPDIIASDDLLFRLSTDTYACGSISKAATKGPIYDLESYKTNPYPWSLTLRNNGYNSLRYIEIQDREVLDENGRVLCKGVDKALKFVRLESDISESDSDGLISFKSVVRCVRAYYADGSVDEISDISFDSSGNFCVDFDSDRMCEGFDIVFEDDYELAVSERVSFLAYTVYKYPNQPGVPDGSDFYRYENQARSVNVYNKNGTTMFAYAVVQHYYDMFPSTETLSIEKRLYFNSATEHNRVGETFRYYIRLYGLLLSPEFKEYKNLRVVDLLPNEVDFVRITGGGELFDSGNDYIPEIVENYHNSGRTALIFYFDYDHLMKCWSVDSQSSWYFMFDVVIRPDAKTGTVRNYAYVVGDNLDEYRGKTGGTEDIYDLNNNGRTDDMIACDTIDAVIVASEYTYAEKFISMPGSDNLNKQGLVLSPGSDFDYILRVTNGTLESHTGMIVYDSIPGRGDKDIFGADFRGTEVNAYLRGPIIPPDGYDVYYTCDSDAIFKSMDAVIDRDTWVSGDSISNWSEVTAYKFVARPGTELSVDTPFEARVPMCFSELLDSEGREILSNKGYSDLTVGATGYLIANSAFGFKTDQAVFPKQSNMVWAKLAWAGFYLQKLDAESNSIIAGTAFALRDLSGNEIMSGVTDESGCIFFDGIKAGEYVLTETSPAVGYDGNSFQAGIIVSQNAATMEYHISFENMGDIFSGSGTSSDKLCVFNTKTGDAALKITKQVVDGSGNQITCDPGLEFMFLGQFYLNGLPLDTPLIGYLCLIDSEPGDFSSVGLTVRIYHNKPFAVPANSALYIKSLPAGLDYNIQELAGEAGRLGYAQVGEPDNAAGVLKACDSVIIKFINASIQDMPRLPMTGGSGVFRYVISGTALIGFVLIQFAVRKRRSGKI